MDHEQKPTTPKGEWLKNWKVPYSEKINRVIKAFSLTEKVIFFFFAGIFALTSLLLVSQVNKLFLITVPDYGGTLTEGVIGPHWFINPILASSDMDKDLTSLIYSGLMRINKNGELIPDLAESYTISDDSLTYTFVLKKNIYFHDGVKLTADDVVFTIEKTQDPNLKSPREANWAGVTVKKIDDRTVSFTLKQPYSPFIQNTTMGILPKHIWRTASTEEFPFSQFNTKPVGSGPYKVNSISYTSSGLPNQYNLVAYKNYIFGEPYITTLIIKSYSNEKEIISAYNNGEIDSLHSIFPKQLSKLKVQSDRVILAPLPRVIGVFFNQNVAPVLVYKEVRAALAIATDKQTIVDSILGGYGQTINSPVPLDTIASKDGSKDPSSQEDRVAKSKLLLMQNGWKQNTDGIFQKKDKKNTVTLSFSISTGDAPELKDTANLLQKQWQAIGANVSVKIFESGDLAQKVIQTRKYDSLLFGKVVGRDLDLYPFWHSSERVNPGLNISLYANLKVDNILETIRKTTDTSAQKNLLNDFNSEIQSDVPAVFTYSPYFIYIVPKKVQGVSFGMPTTPSERFSDVSEWYIETNDVWKIFASLRK